MDDLINLFKEYGVYVAMPVVVAGIIQSLKRGFRAFSLSSWGIRIFPLLPIVLGVLGGFLLPLETYREKILIGGGLGQMSTLIYELVTKTITSGPKMSVIQGRKTPTVMPSEEVVEPPKEDSEVKP